VAEKIGIQELRRAVLHFLDDAVLYKDEEARTKLEDLVVETGRAFADALHRYALQHDQCAEPTAPAKAVTDILRAYNEINRREVDIAAIDAVRTPVMKG